MKRYFSAILALSLLTGCQKAYKPHQLTDFEYTSKVDTNDHPITPKQERRYTTQGFSIDNMFDAARMNGFKELGENEFEIQINPENSPINMSPWYAFRVVSTKAKTIDITLNYADGHHRYWPKTSADRKNWQPVDSSRFSVATDSLRATMTIDISTDTLYISAQEIIDSNDMKQWTRSLNTEKVTHGSPGKSRLGRELLSMDITNGSPDGKEVLIVLSRQHPPEVTGNLAMMHFLEEIVNDSELSNRFLDKYRVLVYPMMNPDGVDLGHWRHNEGGIDLNRDWAYYRQPEVRQVCEDIIDKVNASEGEVTLGLDFHSTWSDIYYIYDDTVKSVIPGFAREWIAEIFEEIPEDQGVISPFAVNSPVSKNWFYSEFKAEGITYEIGDGTPRDLIKIKGQVGAREMMKILLAK